MIRILAVLAGLFFILAGLVGYGVLPQFLKDGLLLGYLEVDNLHNMIHLSVGVLALLCASSRGLSKVFFALFGILFAILAGVGFYNGGDLVYMHVNMADNYFHAGVAAVFLLIGLTCKS